MVSIFTGLGAGAERGSANVLGNSGLLGSGSLGRSGEQVLLNAATGNLMVQQRDEMLVGRGPDAMVGRTYNSLGDLSDENGDNWRMSLDRRVYGLTGTANTTGSTIKRVSGDGSEITYTWNATTNAYVGTDGAGAYDKLVWTSANSTWTWTDGDTQATETYDYSAGSGKYLISKATDAKGNALTFTYLTGGKLSKVTTADGGTTTYTWSGNNITLITTGYTDLATGTAKTLTRTRYGYDSSNRLSTVTVDLSPNDNSVTDGKTYVTTYGYDGTSKRVASITHTDGSSLTITYDTSARVKTMVQTAASGVTRTTSLDYQTGYTNVTDPTGQITRLDYDAKGQLTKITAPAATSGAAQQVTQFGYTANGDLTSVIDPLGNTTSYTNFTSFGEAQTVTDRLGNVTTRTFGSKNELLTETTTAADQSGAAVQHTARWVYDNNDRVRFEISADGNVIEHRYDDTNGGVETQTIAYTGTLYNLSGLTATQTPTLSQMTTWAAGTDQTLISKHSYQYDARGNMTASYGYGTTDSSGNGTAQSGVFYTYDQAGELLSTNTYAHAAQTYVYDGLGRVVSSVDLWGGTTSIVFNDAATSTVVTLAGGLVQTSTYNKAGDLVSFAESGVNTTVGTATYKYDALGRMRMSTDATGHNAYVVYDKAGRKVADVDHYGMLTEYKYDADNRVVATVVYNTYVTSTQLTSLADPLAANDIASLRPAANAKDMWTWRIYDKEGRVIETIDGTGHSIQYEYDASGRLAKTTTYYNVQTAAKLSSFKTTPPTTLNLPTADAARDRVARTFYDKSGRMVGMLDGEGYLSRIDYDAAGRKVAETAFATATTPANRAAGTFTTLTTGLANAATDRTTRYVYDGQGLLVFTVNALNQVTEQVYPAADAADVNGLARQTIRYAGPIANPSAWTVAGLRAALGNASLTGNANNRSTWAIYDNRDRLTYAIDGAGGVVGYKYDTSGNVTKVTRFATVRITTTLPDSATMDSWASSNAVAASDRVTRSYYDARNELRYAVDGEGYVTRTDYDAEGRTTGTVGWFNPISVTDSTTYAQVAAAATGTTITTAIAYDNDGRVASRTDGTGAVTSYVYDAAGGMLGKTYRAYGSSDQVLTQYTYDTAGRVLSQTEASGASEAATTSFAYDGLGNVLTTTDPLGNTISATYDRAGRRVTSTDQEGLVTSYQYDAFDDLVATTDPRGQTRYSYYDTLGRVSAMRDADSRVTTTAYNAFSEIATMTRYANFATNAASATAFPAVTADAARDTTVSYAYDKAGRAVTTIDPELAATTRTYNAFGELATQNDPLDSRTIQTKFTYDRRGALKARVVDAATGGKALTTTYGFDAFGRQVTLVDAINATTTKTYDNDGRLLTSKDALNNVTTYAYDKRGNLAAVTDASGAVTRYAYDKRDEQVYVVDALGNVVKTVYDASGNAIETIAYAAPISLAGLAVVTTVSAIAARATDSEGFVDRHTHNVYDKDNRLRFVFDPMGDLTEYTYDAGGNVIRATAYAERVDGYPIYTIDGVYNAIYSMTPEHLAASPITRDVYDAAGQRTYHIDALGYVTVYGYDARGNRVTQQQLMTAYTGTDDPTDVAMASWVSTHASAADRTTRGIYDRDDRLRFDVDGEGYVTQYTYDQASHVAQTIRYADRYAIGATTTLAQAASLVGATPPASAEVTAYTYDSAGRLDTKVLDPGSGKLNLTTTYAYDGNGNVVATTNALGYITRNVYDAINRRIFTVDAEGAVTKTSYDALGRVVATRQYATKIARTTLDAYPKAITAAQAQVATAATDRVTRMLYDADGRQIYTVDGMGYVAERRYDSFGNVTAMIRYAAAVSVDDTVTLASLAALLPATIPASAIRTSYTYDLVNRLTQKIDDDGPSQLKLATTYAYDTDGNVVATTDSYGRVTRYVYDKLDRQIWSVDAAGYAHEMRYDAFDGARTVIDYANRAATAATMASWPTQITASQVTQGLTPATADRTTRSFYDHDGRAIYAIDGEGYVTETRYDAVGSVVATIRYPAPIAATDAMSAGDIAALLPTSIPADAAVTSYTYDRANRVTDTTDATGSITHFDMDALGEIVNTTRAYGTAQAATTARVFDRVGNVTRETRGAGTAAAANTDYGYDAFDEAVTIADPLTFTTRRDYDALGRVVREYVPVDASTGHDLTTTKVYDAFGRVVQVTDPSGNNGYFHYDHLDRLTVQVDPEGYVTQTTYTSTGQKESVTRYAARASAPGDAVTMPAITRSAADAVTTFAYDSLDRLVATTDAQGFVERYSLNAFGDSVAVTNKLGGVTFNTFDHRGLKVAELTQVRWTDPAQNLPMGSNITNTFAYDSRGNLTVKVEATGRAEARTTQYGYDKLDRLISTTHDAVDVLADPASGTIAHVTPVERSTYDPRGNLIESIDATGARTLIYYDAQDRKIAQVNAAGTLTAWQYDASGNVQFQRVYGDAVSQPSVAGGSPPSPVVASNVRETAYTYDRANRLLSTSIGAVIVGRYDGTTYATTQGLTTANLYDGLGNVVRATDGNGGFTFHYFDKLGREIAKVDAAGYLTTWQRDAEGNVTLERRYAAKVTGTFDQMTAVATLVANTPVDAVNDRVTAFTYNRNGQRLTETRFAVGGLMNGATGAVLANADATVRYTYNGLGEVLAKYEATGDATNYTYDDSGRLIRQQDAAIASLGGLRHTSDFTYDGLNNLIRTRESASANTSAADLPDPMAAQPVVRAVTPPVTTTNLDFSSADGYSNITGTAANDYIYAANADSGGSNSIGVSAGNGDDWVVNESWNGQSDGGAGNDVLEFRAISQVATGGAGSDIFVFDMGNLVENAWALDPSQIWATVTDFTKGADKIAILNSARSFADLTLTQSGTNVVITMQHAPKIVVRNMTVGNFSASDFIISRDAVSSATPRPNVVLPPITNVPVHPAQGTALNDLVTSANGAGATDLFGKGGDDYLISEDYQGYISGGDGNDVLESRANDVTLIGGSGNDTYVFDIGSYAGADYSYDPSYVWGRIVGFTSGRDRIVIPGRTYADLTLQQVGANVEITMANKPRIIVELTTLAQIQPSDFLFPGSDASTPAPAQTAEPATAPATPGTDDRITSFVYGAGGRLLSQTDAGGFTHNFAYDAAGRVVRDSYDRQRSSGTIITDGQFTVYDGIGRTVGQYAATLSGTSWLAGDIATTTYNAFGDAAIKSVNNAVQEQSVFDAMGRVVKSNAGDGVWREYTYDGNGNVTRTVASNGFATNASTVGDLTNRGASGAYDATVTYTMYDQRNLATASYELQRQIGPQADGSSFTSQTFIKRQVQNAFGEIVQDIDARGAVTDYRFNTLGKLIERDGATVTMVDEHGVATSQRPVERHYYDLSGRAVGMDDANGRRTFRTLLEGGGYGDADALVLAEHRPDSSTATTEYDIFGDAKALVDGLGRRTDQVFDKMGRLIAATHPASASGVRLTDYYAYDGLGQRIRHSNSFYQTPVAGQSYPYYDADAGGTFYMSSSGPYLVMGDQGGADGTYGGMTMPVSYPAPGPDGSSWGYDTTRGYAQLTLADQAYAARSSGGAQPSLVTEPDPGDGGGGGGGGGGGTGGYYPGTDGGYASGLETTDYDRQGRVIASVNFAGDLTSYAYAWNGSLSAGLGVSGGWTRTISTIADRAGVGAVAASDSTDTFGHLVARTDMGGHAYAYGFDLGGHSISETESVGGSVVRSVANTYYNTGRLGIVAENGGKNATYGYDANGNRVYERMSSAAGAIQQDGRATYDALNRRLTYRDQAGDGGLDTVDLSWSYDATGNIRSLTQRYRPMDPGGLSGSATTDQTFWFLYDSLNRVVLSQGTLVGSGATATIQRGWGVEMTYDAAGQRRTATTATSTSAPGYAPPGSAAPTAADGAHRESYTYSDDGQLIAVDQANAGADGVFGPTTALSRYNRDLLGRTLTEDNYDSAGAVARSRHAIVYDNRDQVLSETDTQRQGSDIYTSNTSNWYGASGVLQSSATQSWKTGGSTTSNDTTTYTYSWRDGPLTSQVTLTNTDGTTQSLYSYDNDGRLAQVQLTGGARPRTISLATDLAGQILTRDETSAASVNPHARNYFFNGIEMGGVSNDGTDNKTFAAAVAEGTIAPPTTNPGPFRHGAYSGSAYANFDRQHDAINPTNAPSAESSYTVRTGDTLASIAQNLWGDANLWYLLAAANGLSGSEALAAGRALTVPNKIVNRANTSDTFRPYDPTEALGDVQPNTPTPKPQGTKKNKCGIFGIILLAVIAVAVTVVTSGAILSATGAVSGGLGAGISAAVGGAAAASVSTGALIGAGIVGGAVGSIVSQGIGVATGIQDKFSWKGVALAAIGGGVGAATGVGGLFGKTGAFGGVGSTFAQGALRGVLSGALTQGIAVATGLQNRFDWAGIAAAGIGGGVSAEVGQALHVNSTSLSAGNIGGTLVAGLAGNIANAATRSLIDGTDFGDNILAALPNVIASTIGGLIGNAANQNEMRRVASAMGRPQAEAPTGDVSAGSTGSANAAANARTAASAANAQTAGDTNEVVVIGTRYRDIPAFRMFTISPQVPARPVVTTEIPDEVKRVAPRKKVAVDPYAGRSLIDGSSMTGTDDFPVYLAKLDEELLAAKQSGDPNEYAQTRSRIAARLTADYIFRDAIESNDFSSDRLGVDIAAFSSRSLNFTGEDYSTNLDPSFREYQYNSVIRPFFNDLAQDPALGPIFAAVGDLNSITYAAYQQTPAYRSLVAQQAQVDRVGTAALAVMMAPLMLEGAVAEGGAVLSSETGWGTRLAHSVSLIAQGDAMLSALSNPFTQRDGSLLAAGINSVLPGNHGEAIVLGLNLAAPAVAVRSLVTAGLGRLGEIGPAFFRSPANAGAAEATAAEVVVTGSRTALSRANEFLRVNGINDPAMRQRILDAGLDTNLLDPTATPRTFDRFKKLFPDTIAAGKQFRGRLGNLDTRVATINYAAELERAGLLPRFEYGVDVGGRTRYLDLVGINRQTRQPVDFVQFVKTNSAGNLIRNDELIAARQIEKALNLPDQTIKLVSTGR